MRRPVLAVPVFASLLAVLPGCLFPFVGNVEPTCPNEGFTATGAVSFGGVERNAPAVNEARLETDPNGNCITDVYGTIELGGGCMLSVQADGPGDDLTVYAVDLWGPEACGLEDTGWSVEDLGSSTIAVEGSMSFNGGDDTVCFDGSFTVDLDLVAENDGETAPIAGTVEVTGVEKAWFQSRTCD